MIDHIPKGNPCSICGQSAFQHRIEHIPQGDPCTLCGMPASRHRVRSRKQRSKQEVTYVGLDGEGIGRKDHRYVLLGAATENGRSWYIEDYDGLRTEQCLDFILAIPQHNTKLFGYALNYDWTMILRDLPDDKIYRLFRPELRQRVGADALKGPKPIYWNGYRLNMQGTKFTVSKGPRYKVVWDIWKFYQSKFVGALQDWKVGTPELWERMSDMKDARNNFDKLAEEPGGKEKIREYNLEELICMATLAHRLVDAHEQAGLKLRSFYGAGSTASAMLKKMGVKEKIRQTPEDMKRAVASAFFGGRFENAVIGEITAPLIYNYDISSAYPYHICFLPCLIHGEWKLTTDRKEIEGAQAALVHYALPTYESLGIPNPRISQYWGPFPFRTSEGSICFPVSSGGGWVWKDEYLAAEKLFPNVRFCEAWVYHTNCDCKPFSDIPRYYLERLEIGKEGPGIVIKLGMNSNYGKLAQSVGKGQFNCWIWAGIITSNTRAQILTLLGLHKDPANMLMAATDGVQTLEQIVTPVPRDTGTNVDIIDRKTGLIKLDKDGKPERKPLGGWEEDKIEQGVFYARPGIYFPLNPTKKQIKKVRGRGVGKGVILENHQLIVETYRKYGVGMPVKVANVTRFCGAKSSIHRSGPPEARVYTRADGSQPTADGRQMPAYGQWVTREVSMSFDPLPKRSKVREDGVYLELRSFSQELESTPYNKALRSPETQALAEALQEIIEQPDVDFSDYELDEPPL